MILNLVPYDKKYDDRIHNLEQSIIQGKSIQLEIIKDHFLSRTTVFKTNYPCLVVNEHDVVIATAIGAKTEIIINGGHSDAGVVYDVKVHPSYRKKGVGKMMAKHISGEFFKKEALSRNFITLKLSNAAVIRLANAVRKIWLYDFVYLTIPSTYRVKKSLYTKGKKQLLSVALFHSDDLCPSYYVPVKNGLGYFHTSKMYRLKIRHINPLFRIGLGIMKKIQPQKYAYLPEEGDMFEFVTLYNHNAQTIQHINEVLEKLEDSGIKYLMVCCRKHDVIYNALKEQCISTYDYYVLSDFPLTKNDEITIDVRCL